MDTIIGQGHQQAVVTLAERKSRLALLRKVECRTTELIVDAVIELLQPLTDYLHNITVDNGKEYSDHQRM